MIDYLEIQKALKKKGFDPGPLDGEWGPLTSNAYRQFEVSAKLIADGQVDNASVIKLFGKLVTIKNTVGMPWLALGLKKKGLREGTKELRDWLKSDGKTLGDPANNPWCGDFMETVYGLSLPNEPRLRNPYLARNWLMFGRPCPPVLGAAAAFWRGTKSGTSGHVGILVGRGNGIYYLLGGNQSNQISVAPIAEARFLGARWPATAAYAEVTLPTMVGGKLSINEA